MVLGGRFTDPFITHLSVVKQLNGKAQVESQIQILQFSNGLANPRRQSSVNTFSDTKGTGVPQHRLMQPTSFHHVSAYRHTSMKNKKRFKDGHPVHVPTPSLCRARQSRTPRAWLRLSQKMLLAAPG